MMNWNEGSGFVFCVWVFVYLFSEITINVANGSITHNPFSLETVFFQ